VLDRSALERNLQILSRVQKEAGVKILCALKGFSFWRSFPLVSQYLAGATASSLNEARLASEELCSANPACEVHACAPYYREDEIQEFLKTCSHITFNSFAQWQKFAPQVRQSKASPGIRVNPEFSTVEVDLYNPAGRYSRLGVTRAEWKPELLEGVEGLHFHALCEQNVDALEGVLERFEAKFGEWIAQMKWVNFGGGHHITRKDYQVERLIEVLKAFNARYPGVEVILEPGEAVGWQTGVLVSTVMDIVRNEMDIAILDISVSCHMPDCLEMPYRPFVLGSALPGEKPYTYRLGGGTCLAGDIAGDYSFDAPLKIGDRIVFDDMIHYTMVKTTFFNGVKHPSIGIWDGEKFELCREFTYEQYKNNLG
jgi:carboxynorspermidine decarboxylase